MRYLLNYHHPPTHSTTLPFSTICLQESGFLTSRYYKYLQLSTDLKTATDAQNHFSQINVHHSLGLTVTDFITVKKK